MATGRLEFDHAITLVGGGAPRAEDVRAARARAPVVIAADGAADHLADFGIDPDAVIGDLDSISDADTWQRRTQVIAIAEQDTTDFEKCLYTAKAPLYIGVGFTGRRVDHTLAVFHAMLGRPDRTVVLLSEMEVMALVPPKGVRLVLAPGARVSLFPLCPVGGVRSAGLEWPIDGLAFRAGAQIGTSNRAVERSVEIVPDGPGLLLMLEARWLDTLIGALVGTAPDKG